MAVFIKKTAIKIYISNYITSRILPYEPDELPGCSTPRYEACTISLSLTVWPRLERLIIIAHQICHVNTFLKNVSRAEFLA